MAGSGAADVFLVKLDPTGACLWSKLFGAAENQAAYAMTVTPSGGVAITGQFSGMVDFGGGILTSSGAASDIFIASFDGSGNHIWSKRFGDAAFQVAEGIAADAAGNLVIVANASGSVKFGPATLTSAGADDIAVAKFDPAGAHIWSKLFGDAGQQAVVGVALDASGNIVFTGTTAGGVDFGGGAPAFPNLKDFYVVKLDPSGGHLFSNQYTGSPNWPDVHEIAVDNQGNVLLTGHFYKTINLGGANLTTADAVSDIFTLKLSPTGAHVWSKQYGDSNQQTEWQIGYGIAADPSGNVLLTGYFGGAIDFGGGVEIFTGDAMFTHDAFVAKLSP
jgi:hypothetical protein